MKRRFPQEVGRLELVGTVVEPKALLSRKASRVGMKVFVSELSP